MFAAITPPDTALAAALQAAVDGKTKPLGALGRLEGLACQLGLIQQSLSPQIRQPHVLVFAGDHGAARAGVSAYPQDVTWQMVENFLAGGAAINVFARRFGLDLSVVDAGVNRDFGPRPGLLDRKLAHGTASYLEAPAMTRAQCEQALASGQALALSLARSGCNTLALGEMGIGNTASASLLSHGLTGVALDALIGRGTGLDDAGLARKRALLAQALARGGVPADPLGLACEYGGFEIVMMAGAMLGAAQAQMVVVVDGFIVTAAALLAHALAPAVREYCVFAHRSLEPGHAAQLDFLAVEPLMALDLRLGEGTGAALAMPLLQASAAFLTEMASFESAGVSGRR